MKMQVLALMASTALWPAVTHAQVTTAPDVPSAAAQEKHRAASAPSSPQDIVVTAQRYQQRLQDVPLSVSAITGDEIKARSATTLGDLQYSIPGLSMFTYGAGENFIQIRGVSNSNGASTVGIYLDETPLSLDLQGNDMNVKLLDMERIEVLRGPQATLYGQSSMGGTIRYIPAAPRLDTFSGSVDGQWSSTKNGSPGYQADATVNLPIVTDKVGLRVAAAYERDGGWIDNIASGAKDINKSDVYAVRGILRLKPTERLDISILGLYQKTTQGSQNFGVDRKTSSVVPTPLHDRMSMVQGKAAYDLDFATLSASASYIDRRQRNTYDVSSFYVPLLTLLGFPSGYVTSLALDGDSSYRIFNSEVRLASTGTGPLTWALGATYRDLKTDGVLTSPTLPNPLPFVFLSSISLQENKSFAVYGEVGYAITSGLKATVGLRYYREDKSQVATNTQFGVTALDNEKGTFDTVNPRFNLSYNFSRNSMVYVNVAKGFRSGGFNNTSAGGGVFVVPPTYRPDRIWTYELGTKHQLFENKLVLDASVYRSVWSDVQSNAFAPGSSLTIVTNSGHVSGWGVDASATARPIPALALTGTVGWNNLAYDHATLDKLSGDPVDNAIRLSYSLSAEYRPRLTETVTGIFRVDYQHAGKGSSTARNFVPPQFILRPARDLVGLRVGADFGPTEVAVFADNLFDEKAPNIIGPFGPVAENLEQRPRIIGISASTKF